MPDDDGLLEALSYDEELDAIVKHIRELKEEVKSGLTVTGVEIKRAVFKEEDNDSFQFELSKQVPAGKTVTEEIEVPYDGRADGLMLGFPDGAQQLVGVRLFDGEDGEAYFPRDNNNQYFASNDFFNEFKTRFSVEEEDTLVAEFDNTDPDKPHFINVMVTLVREDGD